MPQGKSYSQSARTIEHNMEMLDKVEGLPLKTMYATIAMAQMMYAEYQLKIQLKKDIAAYEAIDQVTSIVKGE